MHLKRLELLGFKSFANKTVLELDQGVTAIVGPNGSGKSNVVDAVRWALGEQSLRAVRSKKSDEVIFAGNSKRAPVGMAEVTLVLDNSDSSLPLAFSEVSVTRRQYRSGEGEYLINRSRARLKDVVELLTHANLGPDAYAVVGQGAVDEVLLQRPEERRALLETAADITRHQLKLKESLDRLSETNGNIQRVEDIQSEITPQLSRLRIQASRARRYEEVAERLRQSLRWRYLLQVRQAVQRTDSALAGERERARVVGESSRSLELLRHRVSTAREQLREQERALEASRERLANLRLAKARGDRELALAREREASRRRELREAEEELAAAQKEHRDLEMEMARLRTSRTAMATRETEARSAIEPVEAERRRAQAEMRIVQAQLDRSAADRQGGATRQSELQERCNALQRQLNRAEDGRLESEEAARTASAKLAQLEGEIGTLAEEMEKLRAAIQRSEARRQEIEHSLAELSTRTEAARRRERESWERDSHLRNRLSLLQSLRNENRGMPAGAKKLLESDLPGIRGVLGSMIQVPQQYVIAVAAALGSAQTHLVSDGFQDALDALGTLRNGSGRATVSPLRMEGPRRFGEPVTAFRSGLNGTMDGLGFHGFASDLVSAEPGAEELCSRYLGLTMVVETLADAVELFQRLNRHTGGTLPFQVVTMDGKLLRARGDLSSAPSPDKEGSLVAMETEIRSLASQAGTAATEKEAARAEVSALEAEHSTLSGEASRLSSEISRLQGELARRTSQHTSLASQLAKSEAAIEWHNSRVSTTDQEAAQARVSLAKTRSELEEAHRRVGDAEARIEQLRGDLSEQQSEMSELSAKLSRLHSQAQAAQGQLREMEARVSALAEGQQRAAVRVRRQEERVSQLRGSIEEATRQPQAAMPAEQREEMEKLESSVEISAGAVARRRAEMESLEGDLARLSGDYGEAREELSQARARVERGSAEMSALLREAARELDLELETAEDGNEPPDLLIQLAMGVDQLLTELLADTPSDKLASDLPAAIQKAEAARKELHSLGTVNPEAPEEYRAVSERHEFLLAQMEDLRQAERTLRKAIEELREIMEERFRASFQRVNEEFGRCFTTLFGGGTARLVLTQPDDPLQGGVDVLATPPGKKPGSLISLSGGERSLTAVALLFALMRVSPGPFCLLDEVDAALDESNVKRFCEMVHTLADNTQFMVITHNRTTMETASALYGVSMSADSVSRVMSLKLNGQGEG